MSSVTLENARRSVALTARASACGLGVALAVAVLALGLRISPPGAALGAGLVATLTAVAAVAHALTATEAEVRPFNRALIVAALAALGAYASRLSGAALEPAFGLAALSLLGAATWRSCASNRATLRLRPRVLIGMAALVGALLAYNLWYVSASKDLEIADFMFFRLVSVAVATLIDRGQLPQLVFQTATSLKADYSWIAGLLPGATLAAIAPLSRAPYQAALMIFYATPALIALGWLARELAGAPRSFDRLALAVIAVAAVYPTGLAVTARGMPDIGGIALYVYALRTADKFVRAAATGRARALTRRLAFALALTLFSMFIFRRWYVFGAVGVIGAVALELTIVALPRWRTFAWAQLVSAGAVAALTGLALLSPILVDWAAEPAKHDYGNLYAAYRKPTQVFLALIGDWWGFGVLALAAIGFAVLLARSPKARLARMTLLAGVVAAVLFLRIQTPYVHHVFLIAPWAAAPAALILIVSRRSGALGLAALAALAAMTLTPLGSLAPKGLFPTYGRPHAPARISPNWRA